MKARSLLTLITLGTALGVGCAKYEDPRIAAYERAGFTDLGTMTFSQAEHELRSKAIHKDPEVLWFYDGANWINTNASSTDTTAYLDRNREIAIYANAPGDTVYLYHQHPTDDMFPPLGTDIDNSADFDADEITYEKVILSRAVDPIGVWEIQQGVDLYYEQGKNMSQELIASLIETKNLAPSDRAQRLVEIYKKYGAEVTFRPF